MGACNDLRFVFPYTGNLTAEKKTEMARKLCGWWNSDAGWEALKKNGRFRTDIRLDMANSLSSSIASVAGTNLLRRRLWS
jgi:hypothetical protein